MYFFYLTSPPLKYIFRGGWLYMYMCIYAYMYAICVYIYTYVYVYIYVYIYVYVCDIYRVRFICGDMHIQICIYSIYIYYVTLDLTYPYICAWYVYVYCCICVFSFCLAVARWGPVLAFPPLVGTALRHPCAGYVCDHMG